MRKTANGKIVRFIALLCVPMLVCVHTVNIIHAKQTYANKY